MFSCFAGGDRTMQKSKKLMAVNALIMDLPMSIVVTLVALLVGHNLTPQAFVMNVILAYIITFLINMFIPFPKWGFAFASKFAQPATRKFGLLFNVLVAFIFTVILDLVLAAVGVLLIAHQPFNVFILAALGTFIPCYVTAYVIALICNGPADTLSRKICHEPADYQHR